MNLLTITFSAIALAAESAIAALVGWVEITDPVGEIFLNKPRSCFRPHPQPLSQLWERGAKHGRIRVSRIRQQHQITKPNINHKKYLTIRKLKTMTSQPFNLETRINVLNTV